MQCLRNDSKMSSLDDAYVCRHCGHNYINFTGHCRCPCHSKRGPKGE